MNKACLYVALVSFLWVPMSFTEEIDLRLYEKRLISQCGEDGVIEKIFDLIGTQSKYYVDFGAGSGHDCSNTKYFREQYGWTGLLLEGGYSDDPSINLHRAFITAENICDLFTTYGVPEEFDLISIDIDNNDFYVWKALSAKYRPRVVVIEFNRSFNYDEDKVVVYNPGRAWSGDWYFGSSILALYNLGRKLGYSLVYQESIGVNLFFIRDDILASVDVTFKNMNDVAKIYTAKPGFFEPNRSGVTFVSSQELLN